METVEHIGPVLKGKEKRKEKYLRFLSRGDIFLVNEKGQIQGPNSGSFSENWIFLGGSKHHWSSSPTVSLKQAFENPSLLNGCLGWDIDHGTTRRWSGCYCGKLPRITGAYTFER